MNLSNRNNLNQERRLSKFNNIFARRDFQLGVIILIGCTFLSLTSNFLTFGNVKALLLGFSLDAIVVIGMTILFTSGSFDLSVGSVFGLGGIVASLLLQAKVNSVLAIILGILSGTLVGLINGLLVTKIGINPLIATLGMLGIVRGIVLVITRGSGIAGLPSSFTAVGQTMFLGLQLPIWIMFVFIIIFHFLLNDSKFFRQYYFIGGNEKAAILTGINVVRLKIISYVICSTLAALAGVLFTARIGASTVTNGQGMELIMISAAVIGGCSLAGGEGSIFGSFLGIMLLALITNAFNLFGFSIYWQRIVSGFILIAAISTDAIIRKRREM